MTRLDHLTALRDAVRDGVATGITGMAFDLFGDRRIAGLITRSADECDVNAALALLPELLPKWEAAFNTLGDVSIWSTSDLLSPSVARSVQRDPARALLLAILEALIAMEEKE